MEIRLNDDQLEIARQARRFLENECSTAYARAMWTDELGFRNEIWQKMVDLGWTAMTWPEEHNGLGLTLGDLAIVLEEMGRVALPGPFFSTVSLFGETVLAAGRPDQQKHLLTKIAAGETMGTLALYEPDGGADAGYIQMPVTFAGDDYVLTGTKVHVPDAHLADYLIVPARTAPGSDISQGVTLFLVDKTSPNLEISRQPTMDGTRKSGAVTFHGVRVGAEAVLGAENQGGPALLKALSRAQVALAAETIGCAQKALELATDYAKVRVQFDQPIGAYQAVKHRCAQMYLEVESARSLLYYAAWAQDFADETEAAMAAAAVKAYAGDIGTRVTASAIQVLGGIGFTWEHDAHLFLKRAKANEITLGDAQFHREQLVRLAS